MKFFDFSTSFILFQLDLSKIKYTDLTPEQQKSVVREYIRLRAHTPAVRESQYKWRRKAYLTNPEYRAKCLEQRKKYYDKHKERMAADAEYAAAYNQKRRAKYQERKAALAAQANQTIDVST